LISKGLLWRGIPVQRDLGFAPGFSFDALRQDQRNTAPGAYGNLRSKAAPQPP
jgi:hypothetical protein